MDVVDPAWLVLLWVAVSALGLGTAAWMLLAAPDLVRSRNAEWPSAAADGKLDNDR